MIKKLKTTYSLISENIFIKYYVVCEKIKNFSTPISDKEKGITTLAFVLISAAITAAAYGIAGELGQGVKDFEAAIIIGLNDLIYWTTFELATFAGLIFNLIVSEIAGGISITKNATYLIGWETCRNLANILIVLGFVVVGISTALRFRDYEAKKLIAPLILLALLINFSGLFCGLIIDAANITTKEFLTTDSGGVGIAIIDSIQRSNIDLGKSQGGWGKIAKDSVSQYLRFSIPYSFMYIICAVTFFYMAVILIARQAVLAILFILSPLAFFCFIFPPSKHLWTKWWDNFLKWSFVGAIAGLFFYIPTLMLGNMKNGVMSQYDLVTISLFYAIGFKVAMASSGMGASAVIGLATGGASLAAGAVSTLGKGALKRAAESRAGTYAQDRATRVAERLGFTAPGRADISQQARLTEKDRMNRINSMTPDQMARDIQNPRMGQNARLDRAAMVRKLAETGQLGVLPQAERTTAINQAVRSGVRPTDLIGGMESTDIANTINTNQYDAATQATGFKTLAKRKDLDLIQVPNRRAAFDNAVQHGARSEEIENADYHYGAQNEARRQRIRDANPTINRNPVTGIAMAARPITDADIDELAAQQVLDENITSMSHEQLRNVDAPHLTARRVERLTLDKINAFQLAPEPTRDAVADHFTAGGQLDTDWRTADAEYRAAAARGDAGEATNRYNEWRRLNSLRTAAINLP